MPMPLAACAWPEHRAAEALAELSRQAGLPCRSAPEPAAATSAPPSGADFGPWLAWAGARAGLEIDETEIPLPHLGRHLGSVGPALIRAEIDGAEMLFVVLDGAAGRLRLIGPDGRPRRVAPGLLRDALAHRHEDRHAAGIDRFIARAGLAPERHARVRAGMLAERCGAIAVPGIFTLRLPVAAGLAAQAARRQAGRRALGLVALVGAALLLELTGWVMIGAAVLEGRLDPGWFLAWTLVLATMVPVRSLGEWVAGRLAVDAAAFLKARLMAGALRIDRDILRRQGVGALLGRVVEGQAFEAAALGGALAAAMALIEIGTAFWILARGAGGPGHALLLAVWLGLAAVLAARSWRMQRLWTALRLALTGDLIERMIGHRTTLAQEQPGRRDGRDDVAATGYLAGSAAMDRAGLHFQAIVPGGWLAIGIAGLLPAFVAGSGAGHGLEALAVGLAGVLFAHRALVSATGGLEALARAGIAWSAIAPLFRAGAIAPDPGHVAPGDAVPLVPVAAQARPDVRPNVRPDARTGRLVDLDAVSFSHAGRRHPVLDQAGLAIERGERLLLEGGSGSGKSTLAGILAGLVAPQAGLVLVDGLDRATLGDQWRRAVALTPQFQENHILSGSLAFNLLMGRAWPPARADLDAAEALCRRLGLGELIDRMPAGLMQPVGESAWQLSQGEASRVHLARALLQRADLTILDESLAALDPESLGRCLVELETGEGAVLVVGHA